MYKTLFLLPLIAALAACETTGAGGPPLSYETAITASNAGQPMQVMGIDLPPRGFIDFCSRTPASCDEFHVASPPPTLTKERWTDLAEVNQSVNRSYSFRSDRSVYGKSEYWTYLQGTAGDCEDFALEKQRRLIEKGWPAESLLITVAVVPGRGHHAVLVATTEAGDYVLDVLDNSVRAWQDVPYQWRKRQVPGKPKAWAKIAA